MPTTSLKLDSAIKISFHSELLMHAAFRNVMRRSAFQMITKSESSQVWIYTELKLQQGIFFHEQKECD